MKSFIIRVIILLLLTMPIAACDNSSRIKSIKSGATVKAQDIRADYGYYLKEIKRFPESVVNKELAKIKYDVSFYKVTYDATDPFGEIKTLS